MAIQDLINEVNSIQTKKQAIKKAITDKGVASEGKLSKFADEIKKISTSEPYWYMINRIRHENGNEGVCIRTNNFNRAVDRITQLTSQGGGRYQSGSSYYSPTEDSYAMITADEKSTAKPCRTITTRKDDNIDFGLSKDNFSIDFSESNYEISDGFNASFKNIASKSFSKDPKQSYLIDNSALLIRCAAMTQSDASTYNLISKVENLLGSSTNAKDYTIKLTGRYKYDSNVKLIPIDSTTFLKAASYRETKITGLVNEVGSRSTTAFRLVPEYGYNDYQRAFANTTLDYGHYMFFDCYNTRQNANIVFVGISEAIDQDSNANKVVEVYTYSTNRIYRSNNNAAIILDNQSGLSFVFGKTYDVYLNFSDKGQQYLLDNISKNDTTIDTIKRIYNSNFISSRDALIKVETRKPIDDRANITNMFKLSNQNAGQLYSGNRYSPYGAYNVRAASDLCNDVAKGVIPKAFIVINNDPNNIYMLDLEAIPDNQLSMDQYENCCGVLAYGIPGDDRLILAFTNKATKKFFRVKKKNTNNYINTALFANGEAVSYLYITTDSVSQAYIQNKPLKDIWTEINNLPKETYSTHNN